MEYWYYNSRLRKETNLGSYIITFYLTYFNSRLRKETNGIVRIICGNDAISTHVSARRRTLRPVHPWDRMNISIHVSARERTSSFKCSLNALSVLQLTSPQGDEQGVCDPSLLWQHFNSRLREGMNLSSTFKIQRLFNFNSRLRKETNEKFTRQS